MNSLTLASLKKNYSLIPLFGIVGAGMFGSVLYLIRLACRSMEVSSIHSRRAGEKGMITQIPRRFTPILFPTY